jgi:hypothetical protein
MPAEVTDQKSFSLRTSGASANSSHLNLDVRMGKQLVLVERVSKT